MSKLVKVCIMDNFLTVFSDNYHKYFLIILWKTFLFKVNWIRYLESDLRSVIYIKEQGKVTRACRMVCTRVNILS